MSGAANRSRRQFLAGLAAAPVAGLAHARLPPAGVAVALDTAAAPAVATGQVPLAEYLVPPGQIHLNTASLGATSRQVLDRVVQAWHELESEPVRMAYGQTGPTVQAAAEQVRVTAAFLGCDPEELLITRCTTDGMNTLAQSIDWKAGDRVASWSRSSGSTAPGSRRTSSTPTPISTRCCKRCAPQWRDGQEVGDAPTLERTADSPEM